MLTYDTIITFTNKPTNLNFYSDSQRTQPIIIENNRYMNFNGFMSLTDNKKIDIPVYWEWPLETGNTEQEIEDNDVEDTTFIGKTMSMQIATTGRQVMENPYENAVASTTINGVVTRYNSVQDAIDAAGTNEGAIVTLLQNEIDENVEIGANQNIVIDTNGKTLTSNTVTILNNGTCKLAGNGTIKTTMENYGTQSDLNNSSYTIKNVGYLILKGATINSNFTRGVGSFNSGKLLIDSGFINTQNTGISSSSTLNSESNPAVIINNVVINTEGNCFANWNGRAYIYNGTFNYTGNKDTPAIINGYSYQPGTIKIYNARVIAGTSRAVAQYGTETVEILNGYFEGRIAAYVECGYLNIIGGTFKSNNSVIKASSYGKITLGTNEITSNVNIANPVIIGGNIGIEKVGSSLLRFYDGIIKVPTGKTLISGGYNDLPTGYHIANGTETIDNQEYQTAYLEKD